MSVQDGFFLGIGIIGALAVLALIVLFVVLILAFVDYRAKKKRAKVKRWEKEEPPFWV